MCSFFFSVCFLCVLVSASFYFFVVLYCAGLPLVRHILSASLLDLSVLYLFSTCSPFCSVLIPRSHSLVASSLLHFVTLCTSLSSRLLLIYLSYILHLYGQSVVNLFPICLPVYSSFVFHLFFIYSPSIIRLFSIRSTFIRYLFSLPS